MMVRYQRGIACFLSGVALILLGTHFINGYHGLWGILWALFLFSAMILLGWFGFKR